MRVLRCFQLVSGLKINFQKSNLFGIGVDIGVITLWAENIKCNVGWFPTTYLGLPLRANPNRIQTWKPVSERFEAMFASWKSKLLSSRGCATLLRSIFVSLPLNFMSIFQLSQRVINELEKIQWRFMWCRGG